MAIIKNSEADRFIARPPEHVFLYLLFGTDTGLVTERARKIIARAVDDPKDPFQLVRLAGDELAADPQRLADEANTVPLFGSRRAIWIESQSKAFVNAVAPVLKVPPRDCTIVIEAGALKKDSPLRSLCERSGGAAAIQCYPDSPKELEQLIEAEAAAAGLSIEPGAKIFLVSQLGQDRLATRLELEKLLLYAHGASEITIGHVEAIVSDGSVLIAAGVVESAFSGDFAALDAGLRHIVAGPADYHSVLAAALRHGLDLHRAKGGPSEAGRRSYGAGFPAFRQKDSFDRQLRSWSLAGLGRAINILAEAIAAVRHEPKLGSSLAARALWSVAQAARSHAPASAKGPLFDG